MTTKRNHRVNNTPNTVCPSFRCLETAFAQLPATQHSSVTHILLLLMHKTLRLSVDALQFPSSPKEKPGINFCSKQRLQLSDGGITTSLHQSKRLDDSVVSVCSSMEVEDSETSPTLSTKLPEAEPPFVAFARFSGNKVHEGSAMVTSKIATMRQRTSKAQRRHTEACAD